MKVVITFRRRGDKYASFFSMSNRLSDGYPGRAQKHTPHNHSRKGYLIARQTIVGRMQYAPTLPEEKSDLMGWRGVMFGTIRDSLIRRTKKRRIFWRENRRRKI